MTKVTPLVKLQPSQSRQVLPSLPHLGGVDAANPQAEDVERAYWTFVARSIHSDPAQLPVHQPAVPSVSQFPTP